MNDSPASAKRAELDAEEEGKGAKTGGGAAKSISMFHQGMHEYKKGKLIFKHSRIMSTYGLDFATITGGFKSVGSKTQLLTVTPYARVPVEILPWYMTGAEFEQLPYGSEVKLCRTVITPLGYRTPYSTNSAGITYTNSDLMVLGMLAHRLNNRFYGINAIPTLDTTNPMKPTATTISKIPACFGQIVHLPQYYCQNTDKVTNVLNYHY